jgi:polyhydroxybutyrate depolymerase
MFRKSQVYAACGGVWFAFLLGGCAESAGPGASVDPAASAGTGAPVAGSIGAAGMLGAGTGATDFPAAGTGAPTAGTGVAGEGGTGVPVAGTLGSAGIGTAGDGAGGTGGSAGPPSSSAEPCTGKSGAPGDSTRMVMNGTLNRRFIVHIPASADPNQPLPVLFVHHGFTMTGQIMKDITGFDAIADSERFIAVYPDGGSAAPWNVGTGICGVGGLVAGVEDDFAFVRKMLESIEADQCVDHGRVFTTGFSMGGYFSNHMGCQNGKSLVRAVAPHSGGTYPGTCPGAPLPVMIVHGTADGLITPNCGTGARDLWVQRNGCSTEFDMRPVMGGRCEWYKNCPAGGQVVYCAFEGMAHGWAGAPTTGANGFYGGGMQFQSASRLIWDFFKEQF